MLTIQYSAIIFYKQLKSRMKKKIINIVGKYIKKLKLTIRKKKQRSDLYHIKEQITQNLRNNKCYKTNLQFKSFYIYTYIIH